MFIWFRWISQSTKRWKVRTRFAVRALEEALGLLRTLSSRKDPLLLSSEIQVSHQLGDITLAPKLMRQATDVRWIKRVMQTRVT